MMPEEPVIGICRLCLREKELKESHVWPQFLYKDYIADMTKGGQVIGIFEGKRDDVRQVKRRWFCHDCEQNLSKSESAIAPLIRRMEKKPGIGHVYDHHLIRYATSISWRVLLLMCENFNSQLVESEYQACKYWRHFLDNKRGDTARFSQHVFVIFDQAGGMHRILSGNLSNDSKLIVSQAGPLIFVGRLTSHFSNKAEENIWRKSEINGVSGILNVLDKWDVGNNLTLELYGVLKNQFDRMVHLVKRTHGIETQRRKKRR